MAFQVGGAFFKPTNGRYVGQFLGIKDGPQQTYTDKDEKTGEVKTKTGNTIKWLFRLYNLDGTPVIDPKTPGEVAVPEGMSSDKVGTSNTGQYAKARVWLTKLLESKGLGWVDPQDAAAVQAMVDAAVGVFVYLTFANVKDKSGNLTEIERMVQPGAAPVPAPVFAAPPVVSNVVMDTLTPPAPVAAPVAMAPQPVPVAAAAFTPVPVPVAPAAAIPVMPFPAAV